MRVKFKNLASSLVIALALTATISTGAQAVDVPGGVAAASTSVAGTATDSATVEVSWQRPAALPLGYSVRATAPGQETRTGSVYRCGETQCRSTVANLNGGIKYTFTVTAFGSASDSSSATVDLTALSVPFAPSARTQVAKSDTQIELGWTAPVSSSGIAVTEYVIRDGSTVVATSSGTSVVVSGLTADTQYTFNLAAKNSLGESATVSFMAVSTLGAPPTAPTAPSAAVSGTSVAVSWTAPNQGSASITGYKVYLTDANGALVGGVRTPTPATATTLTVTGLADATYRVSIAATNRWGDSASSSQTSFIVASVTGSSSGGSGGAAPVASIPATSSATSSSTSSPATQSSQSSTASDSAQVPVGPGPMAKISDYLVGLPVSAQSKEVVINRAWRLVRARVGEQLQVIIRDLAPARARVSTWARTPDGLTFRLAARTTAANGVLTSPAYEFTTPGNYKISWVYRGVKRSIVVFVSE